MLVSIITATFNRENTLSRALTSINNQTYKNIQKVIIDGASTDKTKDIVKPYLNHNDIFLTEPDEGIYDALNKGISLSKGEIIGFLHSDDIYNGNDILRTVMNIFLKQDIDIVYGDLSYFKKFNPEKVVRTYRSVLLSKKNLAWGKMPAHPTIFIKKKIYKKIGLFNTDYRIAGDYEFLCRLVNNYNFKAIHIPKIFINMQLGGASTKGIKNTYILNKETYRAILSNGIYTNIFMLLSKYFFKIREFY